jgi:hypothetical protein
VGLWLPPRWPPTWPGRLPDPATIDYLVVDIQRLGGQRRLYERLVGPDKEFRVVFAKDGIVVARRALPPARQRLPDRGR